MIVLIRMSSISTHSFGTSHPIVASRAFNAVRLHLLAFVPSSPPAPPAPPPPAPPPAPSWSWSWFLTKSALYLEQERGRGEERRGRREEGRGRRKKRRRRGGGRRGSRREATKGKRGSIRSDIETVDSCHISRKHYYEGPFQIR